MARKKTSSGSQRAKMHLAERIKEIRLDLFGEEGAAELARRLNIPTETWQNYEKGVTVPAEVILRFIDLTSVDPKWLLFGLGEKHRTQAFGAVGDRPMGDLLNQICDRLQAGHLMITVGWKKSE